MDTWFLIQVCNITTVRNESKLLHKTVVNQNNLTKHYYNCKNITDCYNLLVNRHRNLHRNLIFKTIEQLELEKKARAFWSSSRLELLEYSEQP